MSTEREIIENTGRKSVDLTVTEYWGGDKNGVMLQLTQGLGGGEDEPGYIQLTKIDAYQMLISVSKWLQNRADADADELQRKIFANEQLRDTIFQDAVDCAHFIEDLKIIEIPLRLLGGKL